MKSDYFSLKSFLVSSLLVVCVQICPRAIGAHWFPAQNGDAFTPLVPDFCAKILHFALSDAIWNMSIAATALNGQKRCAHIDLVPTFAPCPNFSMGSLKKECVHISTQRVPYAGVVPSHQVWTLPLKEFFSALISFKVNLILIQARRSLAKAKTQSAWERVCTMRWQAATFRQTFWFLFLLYMCVCLGD